MTKLAYISKLQPPDNRHYGMDIYDYISLSFSLNNMRTVPRCIESNFIINFCGMLMKIELQYLSLLNTNECNNDLVKVNAFI